MQKKENDVLYFSRKEKNGILLILLLNLVIYFWPDAYDYFFHQPAAIQIENLPVTIENEESHKSQFTSESNFDKKKLISEQNNTIQYFEFDPNTCSKEQWMQLGIKQKTAETILKYVSKGGKFKVPEDLKKIWGLSEKQVSSLMPFVKIKSAATNENINNQHKDFIPPVSRKIIELNTADSASLESLPGIGPALSGRIIKYRNKLGGFYNTDQLKEVWGLQDSVFQKIRDRVSLSGNVEKININTADFSVLKSHPYIGYKLANVIINYRKQHGIFNSLDDIQKIIGIDEKTFNQLSHYLITN